MAVGQILWHDLTVPNATEIRDFYAKVVGWGTSDVDMGEYSDYCVHSHDENTVVAGVCHARGQNANIPAQWMMYVEVADVRASAELVIAEGGKVVCGVKPLGDALFAVIQDPAGAYMGLYQVGAGKR